MDLPPDIPPLGGRQDLETARVCLKEAMSSMVPTGELTALWDEFAEPLLEFTEGTTIAFGLIQSWRCGFEALVGDDEAGEHLIAAAKLSLSAFVVGFGNPYISFYPDRDERYDDIHPLAEKALREIHAAYDNPRDFTVRMDNSRPEKLGKAMEQNFMRDLIQNAVRPGDKESDDDLS